jgi:hypothetical protein
MDVGVQNINKRTSLVRRIGYFRYIPRSRSFPNTWNTEDVVVLESKVENPYPNY